MAIFLGNEQPQWPKQVRPSPLFPHYVMAQGVSQASTLPGFSDDAATGMCIKITWTSGYGYPSRYDYINKAGTASTDGVWNGGLVIGDITDADTFEGQYMDDTDECLYLLVKDTTTTPDNFKLVSVDKEGVLTQSFAWTTPSGTSFDHGYNGYYMGSLFRAGGDGSGNFEIINSRANIGEDGYLTHIIGAIMTFASLDGALTEAALVPDTAARVANISMYGTSVTTSNNVVGMIGGNVSTKRGGTLGTLLNKSTGNTSNTEGVLFPMNISGSLKLQSDSYYPCGGFWRGYYWLGGKGYAGYTPLGFWNIADIHNMVDEMAVQYGIL